MDIKNKAIIFGIGLLGMATEELYSQSNEDTNSVKDLFYNEEISRRHIKEDTSRFYSSGQLYTTSEDIMEDLERCALISDGKIVITKNPENGNYVYGFYDTVNMKYDPKTFEEIVQKTDKNEDLRITKYEMNQTYKEIRMENVTKDENYLEIREEDNSD